MQTTEWIIEWAPVSECHDGGPWERTSHPAMRDKHEATDIAKRYGERHYLATRVVKQVTVSRIVRPIYRPVYPGNP